MIPPVKTGGFFICIRKYQSNLGFRHNKGNFSWMFIIAFYPVARPRQNGFAGLACRYERGTPVKFSSFVYPPAGTGRFMNEKFHVRLNPFFRYADHII